VHLVERVAGRLMLDDAGIVTAFSVSVTFSQASPWNAARLTRLNALREQTLGHFSVPFTRAIVFLCSVGLMGIKCRRLASLKCSRHKIVLKSFGLDVEY